MAGKFTLPANGDPYQWDKLYQIGAAANGLLGWGRVWNLVSLDDDSNYLLTLRNLGAGGLHLNVARSTDGVSLMTMTDSGMLLTALGVGELTVTGNALIGDAAGDAHVFKGTVNVQNAADFDSTLNVDGAVTFGSTLNVTGLTTVAALTATGNVALGDANTDAHTVIGLTTFRNAAGSATQLYVDAANARVLVGTATAMTAAADDLFAVAGGVAYFAGNSGPSLGLRYNAAQTVGWTVGVTAAGANADLVFKDDGNAETFRVGDTSSAYQATVTGDLGVTSDLALTGTGALIKGDFSNATIANRLTFETITANASTLLQMRPSGSGSAAGWNIYNTNGLTGQRLQLAITSTTGILAVESTGGGALPLGFYTNGSLQAQLSTAGVFYAQALIAGATALSGTEELRVVGQTRLEGLVEVIGNDIRLEQTQSLRATDGAAWRNLASIDSGDILQYGESGATGAVVNADYVQLKSAGTVRFSVDTTGLGFYGTAPIAKPTIVGAKGGNVALANLLTALANLGLLIDLTT